MEKVNYFRSLFMLQLMCLNWKLLTHVFVPDDSPFHLRFLNGAERRKKICFRNPMRRGKIFLSLENLNEHLMSMKHRVKFIAQDLLAVKSKKTPIMTKHIQMTPSEKQK